MSAYEAKNDRGLLGTMRAIEDGQGCYRGEPQSVIDDIINFEDLVAYYDSDGCDSIDVSSDSTIVAQCWNDGGEEYPVTIKACR
jgi:hypothetical protein